MRDKLSPFVQSEAWDIFDDYSEVCGGGGGGGWVVNILILVIGFSQAKHQADQQAGLEVLSVIVVPNKTL